MKRPGILLLLFCLLVNLVQARYTELSNDEAYYWVYSRFPAWSYFDHPPMVALFIKVGYWLFQNELGVRLLTALAQVATILLTWRLVDRPGKENYSGVFVLLSLAIPIFQVYGFITTPDVPLLLFTALFFNVYKSFTERITTTNTILLGVTMALLLYSKHHGLLLLVLVVLSNFRLLRTWNFYLASLIGVLLLLPQLWWQYKHEFPSIYYHFYWRTSEFNIDNVTGFVLGQLFVFSLLFPWLAVVLIRKQLRAKQPFERALLFTLWGFLLYFFAFSFRTRIEVHWTLICCIPVLYFFIVWYMDSSEKARKWITGFAVASALLVFAARSVLFFDILPQKNEFHKSARWTNEVKAAAKGANVIFSSSFQRASKYSFYTKDISHSLNTIWYRQNQFDIWNIEENFHGKPVMMVALFPWNSENEERLPLCNGDTAYLLRFGHFETTQKVRFNFEKPEHDAKRSEIISIPVEIMNQYPYTVSFENPEMPVRVRGYLCEFGKIREEFQVDLQPQIKSIGPGQTIRTTALLHLPDRTGTYNLGLSLNAGKIPSTFNSVLRLITIR